MCFSLFYFVFSYLDQSIGQQINKDIIMLIYTPSVLFTIHVGLVKVKLDKV
jgi:hypothetical protein